MDPALLDGPPVLLSSSPVPVIVAPVLLDNAPELVGVPTVFPEEPRWTSTSNNRTSIQFAGPVIFPPTA